NRRPDSSTAQWCSLRCILRTHSSAVSTSGHDAPIFTGDLHRLRACREPAGALRHVRTSRALGLLRLLRPTPAASADDAPSLHPAGRRADRGPPGWFPCSLRTDRQVRCPAMPLRPRHGYAADLHRGLPPGDINRPKSCPARDEGTGARRSPSPYPPGLSWCFSLKERSAAGSSRTPSRLACRTRPVWRSQGVPSLSGLLPALPGVSRVRLPPASPHCCDSTAVAVSHLHSVRSASRRSISQLQIWLGARAARYGLVRAWCRAWARRSRTWSRLRSSRYIVDTDARYTPSSSSAAHTCRGALSA